MVDFITPRIFMLARTQIEHAELSAFLDAVGAPEWETDAASDEETLAEVAGRLCYKSFKPGLNPNVTKVREGNLNYIGNIIGQQHGSVLEHPSVSFAFLGVSRVFTHELVRHRAGMAYSQESLRFVRLDALTAYYPQVGFGEGTIGALWDGMPEEVRIACLIKLCGKASRDTHLANRGLKTDRELFVALATEHLRARFQWVFEEAEKNQREISEALGLDHIDGNFGPKKKVTSAMRRMAPDGLGTAIIATSNHRAMRDIISRRTHRSAEEEVRLVYSMVWHRLHGLFPAMYQDSRVEAVIDGIPEIVFDNPRV